MFLIQRGEGLVPRNLGNLPYLVWCKFRQWWIERWERVKISK